MSNSHKPYTLAITASIGCGKSTVRRCLEELGITVVDTDSIAHQLLNTPNPIYQAILDRFGDDLVDLPNGPINRKKLGAIVFADSSARADLNALMHPAIRIVCKQRIASAKSDVVAVEVPLLFESGQQDEYDEVWAVLAESSVRLSRLMKRDAITVEQAQARINAQWAQEKKASLANRIIDNSGTVEETRAQVVSCLARARAAAKLSAEKRIKEQSSPEYADILKRFGYLGTDQALEQMGDLSGTAHKEANATMTLTVDSVDRTGGDHNRRELQVDVHMSVKQTVPPVPVPPLPVPPVPVPVPPIPVPPVPVPIPPEPDPDPPEPDPDPPDPDPPTPVPDPPTPVPDPPTPVPDPPTPVPDPPTPVPDPPVPTPPRRKWRGWIIGVLLAALLAAWALLPGTSGQKPGPPPTPPPIVQTSPAPLPPYVPPAPGPTADTVSCPSTVTYSSTMPDFVFQQTHNNVRARIAQWKVEPIAGNCGAIVTGRDAAGQLVNLQSYGPQMQFQYQWTVAYGAGTVQVDRFEAFNHFVGRTIYFFSNDTLTRVQKLDGHQRLLVEASFNRFPGRLAVALKFFDVTTGRQTGSSEIASPDIRTVCNERFYLFDTFGQLN